MSKFEGTVVILPSFTEVFSAYDVYEWSLCPYRKNLKREEVHNSSPVLIPIYPNVIELEKSGRYSLCFPSPPSPEFGIIKDVILHTFYRARKYRPPNWTTVRASVGRLLYWRKKNGLCTPKKVDVDWIIRSAARWYYEIYLDSNIPRDVITNLPVIISISKDILPNVRRKGVIYYDVIPAIWAEKDGKGVCVVDFAGDEVAKKHIDNIKNNKAFAVINAVRLWAISRLTKQTHIKHTIFFPDELKVKCVTFDAENDYTIRAEDAEQLVVGYTNTLNYPVPLSALCLKNCKYKEKCRW